MPSSGNYNTAVWLIVLLHLAACSQAPVVDAPRPVATAPADARKIARPDRLRQSVTSTARNMLGTPYRYGGTSPKGFDCSGLVWFSHQRAGIRVPRTALQQYRSVLQRVAVSELRAGDLLFFRIGAERTDHVGIYVGNDQFIHAPSSGGQVSQDSLNRSYWKERLLGAGNFY